jgi:HEAT repeat protein
LRAANQGLASASPSEVRKGLLALAELGGDGAARALAKRMHAGLPPALLGDAIDVAVQLGSPRAVPELVDLLQHKRASVRKHALEALAALKAKSAQSAMLIALDDPDADVRRAAIAALAELGNTRALPALLALVQRGQPGALEAVGKLAAARDLATLVGHAPGGDVTQLKPALAGWLAVASRSPGQQLELLAALAKVASPSARTYLVEWLDAAKSSGNPRVRQALFAAIKQLDQTAEVASTTTKTTHTTVQGVQVIARADAPEPVPAAASAAPTVASSTRAPAHTEAAR